ncbi:MAG TPA: CAP domain-containing protein [Pseudoflavonifractor sp.]|nr:CAP domain-containing protein [Pseudoflavonifractor sp.]
MAVALGLVFAFFAVAPAASAAWDIGFAPSVQVVVPCAAETAEDTADTFCADALELINEKRAETGLAALEYSKELKAAADIRAADIRAKEAATNFAHVRPDGQSVGTAFAEQGIVYKSAGETLAHGYVAATELVDGWMNSESHKNVLLNAGFTNAALGYYQNSDGEVYCALLLFTPTEG